MKITAELKETLTETARREINAWIRRQFGVRGRAVVALRVAGDESRIESFTAVMNDQTDYKAVLYISRTGDDSAEAWLYAEKSGKTIDAGRLAIARRIGSLTGLYLN